MTYTVYIPDVERGPTAYTQRAFTSIKELARWAMDEALAEPPRVDVVDVEPMIKAAQAMVPTVASLFHEKLKENTGVEELLAELTKVGLSMGQKPVESPPPEATVGEPPVEESPVWDLDTDAWFAADDSLDQTFKGPVGERNWRSVATKFCDKIVETGFENFDVRKTQTDENGVKRMVHNPNHIVMRSDLAIALQLAVDHAALVGADLFPEVPVRWELLPPEFKEECRKYIQRRNPIEIALWPSNPLTKGIYQIIRFFADGKRHQSWSDANLSSGTFRLGGGPTAIQLISDWWSGVRASDAVREFMIKAVTVRTYASEGGSDIGGAEFLSAYTGHVAKMELPAVFIEWATRGTTHRHCKKALGELGVGQVRTAAGQRYKGLRPITNDTLRTDVFVFNNDLPAMNGMAEVWPGPFESQKQEETLTVATNKGEITVPIPKVYDGVQNLSVYPIDGNPSPTFTVTSA